MFNRKLSALIAVALVASTSTPAFANGEEARSVVVSVADLDLSTAAGVAQLERRVRRAAADACDVGTDYEIGDRFSALRCYSDAVAGSREAVTRLAAKRSLGAELALRVSR